MLDADNNEASLHVDPLYAAAGYAAFCSLNGIEI
jgi:hypothetical protein